MIFQLEKKKRNITAKYNRDSLNIIYLRIYIFDRSNEKQIVYRWRAFTKLSRCNRLMIASKWINYCEHYLIDRSKFTMRCKVKEKKKNKKENKVKFRVRKYDLYSSFLFNRVSFVFLSSFLLSFFFSSLFYPSII